jgi:hypothetical protein
MLDKPMQGRLHICNNSVNFSNRRTNFGWAYRVGIRPGIEGIDRPGPLMFIGLLWDKYPIVWALPNAEIYVHP